VIRLQPLTRSRVRSLGEEGTRWLEKLPGVLEDLASLWGLAYGRALPGGSGSYVVTAVQDGREVVLKVAVDGALGGEVAMLRRAGGRGYCALLDADLGRQALLLERLGRSLWEAPLSTEAKLHAVAETLDIAWMPAGDAAPFDKATELVGLLEQLWPKLGRPCSERVWSRALSHARELSTGASRLVWVHGDAHPANTLARGDGWAFVDPDGFVADPAYDLGVLLRDWSGPLLAGDATGMLRDWASLLAGLTGLDAERVLAWAFVERVSTGLYVLDIGAPGVAQPFFDSAERLAGR
jgi:streptomycin 6-kinase